MASLRRLIFLWLAWREACLLFSSSLPGGSCRGPRRPPRLLWPWAEVYALERSSGPPSAGGDPANEANAGPSPESLAEGGGGGFEHTLERAAADSTAAESAALPRPPPAVLDERELMRLLPPAAGGHENSTDEGGNAAAADYDDEAAKVPVVPASDRSGAGGGLRNAAERDPPSKRSSRLRVYTKCDREDCPALSSPARSPRGLEGWVTVSPDGTGDYTTLPGALLNFEKDIFLRDGLHVFDSTLILGKAHRKLRIRGESTDRTILRFTGEGNFLVLWKTDFVTISGVTIDAGSANLHFGQVCEVIGVVDCNHVSIVDTVIHASSNMRAVLFDGPEYASSRTYGTFFADRRRRSDRETIRAYDEGYLNDGNVVRNAHVYSDFDGEALVFTLQRNGEVTNNRVVSGSITFGNNVDSVCDRNTVVDSPLHGIRVTVPADSVAVRDNKILRARYSGIEVARPRDRRADDDDATPPVRRRQSGVTYRATGVYVTGNQIFDVRGHGLDVELTHGAVVTRNAVTRAGYSGVRIRASHGTQLRNNRIEDFGLRWEDDYDGGGGGGGGIVQKEEGGDAGVYGDGEVTALTISDNILIDSMDRNNSRSLRHGGGKERGRKRRRHGIRIEPSAVAPSDDDGHRHHHHHGKKDDDRDCVIRQNVLFGDFLLLGEEEEEEEDGGDSSSPAGVSAPDGAVREDNSVIEAR